MQRQSSRGGEGGCSRGLMSKAIGWPLEQKCQGGGGGLEQFSSKGLLECVFPLKALSCPVAGRLLP